MYFLRRLRGMSFFETSREVNIIYIYFGNFTHILHIAACIYYVILLLFFLLCVYVCVFF